jgi:glycosyltransferase involved in cell wall biosynthesis
MDLFGDMLFRCFRTEYAAEVDVQQLRPAMHRHFSKLPGLGASKLFWNLDRLLNRHYDYPLWLKGKVSNLDLIHIVDHSYAQLALRLPNDRIVVTCHDLDTFRCLLEPEAEPRPRWFRAMAERTKAGFLRASQVICPSAFTKAQLLRYGWFSADQVTVIAPGVDPVFFDAPDPETDLAASQKMPPATEGYLLHVGSVIPRKRIDVLLRVFAQVLQKFPGLLLVRVGGAFTAEQSRLAIELGLKDKVVETPHLTKEELASVYRRAAIVLQTSEAEGFGLPVIEAMACGCLVVASDIAALREAGGSAAAYCPVADIQRWSETVVQLLDQRKAAPEAWKQRIAEARQHAAEFTWSKHAGQTLAVYHRICRDWSTAAPWA